MKQSDHLDAVFKAISDAKRRDIFHMLMMASAAMSITQISSQFDITRQGLTKHIHQLEEAGLVKTVSKGRERYCEAVPERLQDVRDWAAYYDQFWTRKLNALDAHLKKDKSSGKVNSDQ